MAAILDFNSKDRNRDGLTIDYNYNSQCNVDSCNFKSRIYLYVGERKQLQFWNWKAFQWYLPYMERLPLSASSLL